MRTNSLEFLNMPWGYIDGDGQPHYYIADYQGNIRVVYDRNGKVEQATDYYPYGMPMATSTGAEVNRYKYSGKELETRNGLNFYDFDARLHFPAINLMNQPDVNARDYSWLNTYLYCAANPIANIDPTGNSTQVIFKDGHYEVYGGNLDDNDNSIYLGKICDGKWVKDCKIGETQFMTSFYNSDTESWAVGSIIDPNDNSGIEFIDQMTGENTPGLKHYAIKAYNGQKYDFKATNGTEVDKTANKSDKEKTVYHYRGMPMYDKPDGTTVYTSARDVGNMVAGYVAGYNLLSWQLTRLGFDAVQSIKSKGPSIEKRSSQVPQFYGWSRGVKNRLMKSMLLFYKPHL